MEKIEMIRELGYVQAQLIGMIATAKKEQEKADLDELYKKIEKVMDGIVADAKGEN